MGVNCRSDRWRSEAFMDKKNTRIILIADDDTEDQEMLEDAILAVDEDIRSHKVINGREAIEFLEHCDPQQLPCAIVLDYSMPVLNGLEVLKTICRDERFLMIPKFIWSTSNASVHAAECLDNGAINYFVKPDHPAALKAMVKVILNAC
jgi:CheY-like chemotaxis protein